MSEQSDANYIEFKMEKYEVKHWNDILDRVAYKPGLLVAEIGAEGQDSRYL